MKSRFWSFIAYPEHDIDKIINNLIELGCCFCVSPLHDKDLNPDGTIKKSHYHIILQFEGPTTYKNVNDNICIPNNCTIPKNVISLRAYYRYLCHLDNPEKAQYSLNDIKCYGGFHCDLTSSEITHIKVLIIEDIENNNIREYRDLCQFYIKLGDYDRLDIVSNHTYFFDKYLTSYRLSKEKTICIDK